MSRIVPSKFDDDAVEALFLQDFRLAGLKSTAYACSVGVAGYILIWIVDVSFNGWSGIDAVRRLVVMALLGLIVLLVLAKPARLLVHYNIFLGSLVFVAYVASVSITHLFRSDDPTTNVSPTALLGLWIIYGFIRLPLKVQVLLGLVGGACALFGSRLTNMHDPAVRTLIYLIIANVLGVTHSRSVEVRERQLFLQRRTLEETQSELRHRSLLAEQASAEKTRLIAAVGHDLRQPMMAAILHLSVLMRRLSAQDVLGVQRQAARVLESVKLLGATLEHLLLAARYEAGTEPICIRPVPLTNLFRRLADLSEPQATEKESALLIRMPRSELLVLTDEQTLLRALVNLVSNAIKFTKSREIGRSRVVVRASFRGGVCRILVADNGIGIASADADAIWQPFFQVANRERNRDSGLGLGLYLVKQSLHRLEGHAIQLRSVLGMGTCFILTLPSQESHLTSSAGALLVGPTYSNDRDASVDLRGMYVLLVEDDHEAREAFQTQLDEWGIVWSSARDMEAIMQAHAGTDRSVDAIIADYRLPGEMDGSTLITAVRKTLGYEPEAILMTADVDSVLLIESLPPRVCFLQKPFDPMMLRRILGDALARALEKETTLRSFDPLN